MKTPLLDFVPGLAVAAPIFRAPPRLEERDRTQNSTDSAPKCEEEQERRQDCKPP